MRCRALATWAFLCVLTLAAGVSGCSGGGGGGSSKPKPPVNNPPVFTTLSLPDAVENQAYSKTIVYSDPEGVDITPALLDAPLGVTLTKTSPTTSELTANPMDDDHSDQTYDIKIRIHDGVKLTEKTFTWYVINTEDIAGLVKDAKTGAAIQNVDVTVGGTTVQTDVIGRWTISNVVDGDHTIQFKDGLAVYDTFKAGFFRVSKISKLEQDCVMIPQADRGFVTDTIRYNGEVRKWKSKPKFRIYTKEVQGGGNVAAATVTAIKDAITTELNQFNQDGFSDFVAGDIEEVNTLPVVGQIPGYVKVYWNNANVGGGNSSQFTGNEVVAAFATFNTSTGKPVHLQELTECLIGSGETNDANYSDSSLHDPGDGSGTYSTEDTMLSLLVYNLDLQRPAGNKNLGAVDNYDVNPVTHQFNQTFIAPASVKMISPAKTFKWNYDDSDCPDDTDYLLEEEASQYQAKPEDIPEVF